VTPTSAWDEHIPFAMNLVDLLRPRTFVELGTHTGDSYCAFCQAVAEQSLETRCYAVDTWRGDAHAGQFGDEVLAELRQHHDPIYGGFSRLVQSTFEEALKYFEDGSIDLLHIDGYHTFEAVKRDFESWLPKMSRRGVVLLHDTNVREREFGVWAFWQEISAQRPHFEFLHGHGLGVLAAGEPPESLRPLLEALEPETTTIRLFFSELGRRLTQGKELQAAAAERERSRRAAEQRDRDIDELHRAMRELQCRVQQEGSAAEQSHRSAVAEVQQAHLRELTEVKQAHLRALGEIQSEAAVLRAALLEARAKMSSVESSKAWRALQHYRSLRDVVFSGGKVGQRLYDRALRRRR
jgi:hypothetical protein